MKKLVFLFAVALMAVIFYSCNKQDDGLVPQKQYASFVAGEIVPQFGEINLKSAPIGVTNLMYMYNDNGGTYTLVNGSEFLPGSDPAVFWSTAGNNPGAFGINQTVYSNYTPANVPIRVVVEQLNSSDKVAFLGITDLTPTYNSFPLNIVCRRLGDKLTLNTDALTSLPGYSTMSFKVSYDVQPIDVEATRLDAANAITDSNWPTLHLGASVPNEKLLSRTDNGEQVIYNEVEGKITGTINVTIYVDGATIVKSVPAVGLGHGLALTLTTEKVGWYDSQNMGITQADITIDAVDIPVN